MDIRHQKLEKLKEYLKSLESVAVAFSSGVDSSFLLKIAHLLDLGFNQVRCRIHGKIARIEISPDEFDKILQPNIREKIYSEYKKIGFSYVALDLKGYRTGSMNETLKL